MPKNLNLSGSELLYPEQKSPIQRHLVVVCCFTVEWYAVHNPERKQLEIVNEKGLVTGTMTNIDLATSDHSCLYFLRPMSESS